MPSINFRSTNIENIQAGTLRAKWNAAGTQILRYYVDVSHKVLGLHKELSAPDIDILQNKADALLSVWDKQFAAHEQKLGQYRGRALAEGMGIEAEAKRSELRSLLKATLQVDDKVDWDVLKSNAPFVAEAFPHQKPREPESLQAPLPPRIGFFDRLTGNAKQKQLDHDNEVLRIQYKNEDAQTKYRAALDAWQRERELWNEQQRIKSEEYARAQSDANAEVERLKAAWLAGETEAVIEHASIVLDASPYPEIIQKDFELGFEPESKVLLINYHLPDPEDIPITKSVRFIAATGELKETSISQKEARDLFDEVCYQICLRTIHEIFEADTPVHIASIVFNGFTNTIDKSTGNRREAVIMSVMVDRGTFSQINLAHIDPKACFKSLKGVSASSLAGLAPVAPVMKLDTSDQRFVDGRSVEVSDDGATNLAAMDWEEFEHLVREVFEKEFASRGGEVKVTRASSDGGVDAVAFDPDPITGGKIVIQAKRYTKTVGVAAVRDLYGTTLSEGAAKGILVTTADYGPDAYKFASDKPITLLTGAHLLHLLGKHGVKAKIDLASARKELGLSSR